MCELTGTTLKKKFSFRIVLMYYVGFFQCYTSQGATKESLLCGITLKQEPYKRDFFFVTRPIGTRAQKKSAY